MVIHRCHVYAMNASPRFIVAAIQFLEEGGDALRGFEYVPMTREEILKVIHGHFKAGTRVNLLHDLTYIHGPFEFATVNNGRKTRDHIAVDDWRQLALANHKYNDALPALDKPVYHGIQFSHSFHTTVEDKAVQNRIVATQFTKPETYSYTSLSL